MKLSFIFLLIFAIDLLVAWSFFIGEPGTALRPLGENHPSDRFKPIKKGKIIFISVLFFIGVLSFFALLDSLSRGQ